LKHAPFHFAEGMFGNVFAKRMDKVIVDSLLLSVSTKEMIVKITYRAHEAKATNHVVNRVPSSLHISQELKMLNLNR
jgi:hypothetical protein